MTTVGALRAEFERACREAADKHKVYVNFDLNTQGAYKEKAVLLAYESFLAGANMIVDGAQQRIRNS